MWGKRRQPLAKAGDAKKQSHQQAAFFEPAVLLRPPLMRAAYSDRTAWIMAKASQLAYIRAEDGPKERAELENALASGGFKLVRTFNQTGTQAYLATAPSLALLAFRGTEYNYRDIVSDINIRFYEDSEGRRTHKGFSRAFSRIADEISEAILDIDPKTPVYITGHSLGGALATIAAKLNPHDNVAACYTFGSPRVGARDYDVHIKIPVYRVVNNADIVARIPWGVFGYTHVGDLRYINRAGQVLRSMRLGGAGLSFLLYTLFFQGPIRDHRIDRYVNGLAKFAEGRIADTSIQGRMADAISGAANAVMNAAEDTVKSVMAPVSALRDSDSPLGKWLRRERGE